MKVLLIETEYNKGIILDGELSETIKLIDKFKPVSMSGNYISVDDRQLQYKIVDMANTEGGK